MALLREGEPESLTFAGIARRAGMTDRTVYRHFENRDALMAAIWRAVGQAVQTPRMPASADELIAQPLTAFPAFDREETLMQAMVHSREGRALRLGANEERKAAMRRSVRDARPDLDGDELDSLCAVVQLLDSSIAWSAMKDYWGLDGAAAGSAVSRAIALLLGRDPAQTSTTKESDVMKIAHASLPADNPKHVAQVLASIMGGVALPFPPGGPDGWMAWSRDEAIELEITPRGRLMAPDDAHGGDWREQAVSPARRSEAHLAICVATPLDQVVELARQEGWESGVFDRGGFFKVAEVWVENAFLIEFLDDEQARAYSNSMTVANWRSVFSIAA